MELTRSRGHPMVGAERSIHDAEEPWAVATGVPATHRRAGSQRTNARGVRTAVRTVGQVHPELGALWQRLLARPASESGTLSHGNGTHGRSDRCRRALVLPILGPLASRTRCRKETSHVLQHIHLADPQSS